MGEGSGVVTAVAWVTAVARVQALAWELLHVAGMAKKKNVSFQYLPRARHCSRSEGGSNNKEIPPPMELTIRGRGAALGKGLKLF